MFDEQIDHIEDVIVNHFGVEVYGIDSLITVTRVIENQPRHPL